MRFAPRLRVTCAEGHRTASGVHEDRRKHVVISTYSLLSRDDDVRKPADGIC